MILLKISNIARKKVYYNRWMMETHPKDAVIISPNTQYQNARGSSHKGWARLHPLNLIWAMPAKGSVNVMQYGDAVGRDSQAGLMNVKLKESYERQAEILIRHRKGR
jgi:hypothetical protein